MQHQYSSLSGQYLSIVRGEDSAVQKINASSVLFSVQEVIYFVVNRNINEFLLG